MFFKKNDILSTPKEFYEKLDEEYHFDFDPCPINPQTNGLFIQDWGERNFINPPYSNIPEWIKKGLVEAKKGKLCVFLIPARTNSVYWFQDVFPNASRIEFLSKKLCFGNYIKPLPVPLALVVFDGRKSVYVAGVVGGIDSYGN